MKSSSTLLFLLVLAVDLITCSPRLTMTPPTTTTSGKTTLYRLEQEEGESDAAVIAYGQVIRKKLSQIS